MCFRWRSEPLFPVGPAASTHIFIVGISTAGLARSLSFPTITRRWSSQAQIRHMTGRYEHCFRQVAVAACLNFVPGARGAFIECFRACARMNRTR
jgi:hypothetical protein